MSRVLLHLGRLLASPAAWAGCFPGVAAQRGNRGGAYGARPAAAVGDSGKLAPEMGGGKVL
jgi:hypothetical protein